MAAFDPDAYLAKPSKPSAAFDPDAYLANKPVTAFDPDAFLGVSKQKGPKVLPETDTSSDTLRGITNYPGQLESIFGAGQALTGLAAKKMGFEDTGKSLIQKGLGKMEEGESKTVVKKSDEFTEAWSKGIGTVLTDWLPYQVGAGAANLAESFAFSALGAGVGAIVGGGVGAVPGAAAGFVSKTLIKQGIKEAAEKVLKEEGKDAAQAFIENEAKKVIIKTAGKDVLEAGASEYAKAGAKKVGSYAGTAAQAVLHGAGEVGERAIEEGRRRGENVEDIDLGRVLPAAAVHAIADFVNDRIGLGAVKIGDATSKYLITEIAKRIGMTGLKETGGEEIQTIAERYGAKLSLADAEALKDYVNTAAASFGMAVAPGAIGGARTHLAGKRDQALRDLQEAGTSPDALKETFTQGKAQNTRQGMTDAQLDAMLNPSAAAQTQRAAPPAQQQAATSSAATAANQLKDIPDLQGTTNGTQAAQAQQTETQKQEAPAAPVTLSTMQPGQQVTLYRGENKENVAGGQWWTTDPAKAAKFGAVTSVTLPAETISQHAAQGHGNSTEFVFPTEGKRPLDLAQSQTQTQAPVVGFTTAKGSTYAVDENGQTSRTKNSEGKGKGTTYEPHTAMYVAPGDHTEILSDMQGGMGNHSIRLGYISYVTGDTFTPIQSTTNIPSDAKPVVGIFDKKSGALVSMYEATTTPQVGLHPVEKLYKKDGTSSTHVGNVIAEVQTAEQTTPTETAVAEQPAPVAIPMDEIDNEIYQETLADFAKDPSDASLLAEINSMERKHNMPLTPPKSGVLSAKKEALPANEQPSGAYVYNPALSRQENMKRAMISATYVYDPKATPEQNLKQAKKRGAKETQVAERKHKATLEETDKKKMHQLEVSKEDREAFEKVREEHNQDARQRNLKRSIALKALETATKKANEAIAAEASYKKELYQKNNKAKKKDAKLTALAEEADKAIKLEEAADALVRSLDAQQVPLIPAWYKLSAEDKNVYFGSIKYGDYIREGQPTRQTALTEKQTPPSRDVAMWEHRRAAQMLVQALMNRPSKMLAAEQQIIGAYNDSRTRVGRQFNTVFPAWRDLSEKAKEVFKEGLTNFAALQLDRSFANLDAHLKTEAAVENTELKTKIGQEHKDRIEQIQRESDEQRERTFKGYVPEVDVLREEVIKPQYGTNAEKARPAMLRQYAILQGLIADGKLHEALIHIDKMDSVSKFDKVIARALASMVKGMKSPPRLTLVNKLPNNDHGQYDPNFESENRTHIGKITIRTPSPTILLHETIHAVTVQVINKYLDGDVSLTNSQIAGVKQLLKIMAVTRDYVDADGVRFVDKHPEAYDNIFEFVSYALTKGEFQNDLANINLPAESRLHYANYAKGDVNKTETVNISNISSRPRSAWTEFKLSVAKLITGGVQRAKQVLSKEEQARKVKEEETGYVPFSEDEKIAAEEALELKAIPLSDLLSEAITPSSFTNQNFLMEIAAAFEDIMEAQTNRILLNEAGLPATSTPRRAGGLNNEEIRKAYAPTEKETGEPENSGLGNKLFSVAAWRNIARMFVDRTYEARSWWARQDLAGKVIRGVPGFNNFTEQSDTSTSRIQNYVIYHLQEPLNNLKSAFTNYANIARNGNTKEAFIDIHMLGEMFGEDERRNVKFVTTVPLNNEANGPKAESFMGRMMSAADIRTEILGDPSKGTEGLIHRYTFTPEQQQALWSRLTKLANTHADYNGYSPRGLTFSEANKRNGEGLRKEDSIYNVLGIDRSEVALRRQQYEALPQATKDAIKKVFDSVKVLTDTTKELNRLGNFWTMPVDNLTGMYNYQYYLPYRGLSKFKETDDAHVMDKYLDPERMTEGKSKVLVNMEYATSGRTSVSDNPILQVMYDAFRGAHRAGIVKATEALRNSAKFDAKKNPMGSGIINAEVLEHVMFYERETSKLEKYQGQGNIVFHYNEDGSIDVIRINDPKLANAIRFTYKKNNIVVESINNITSWFGSMHTRYNWNFAPKNFVVDMLTNAWNIGGGKFGPATSLVYIKDVGFNVMKNGLGKAWLVAYLHDKGDLASQKQLVDLAEKDSFVRDMLEMLKYGGKSVYMDSMTLRSNYEKLSKIKQNGIFASLDQFNAFLDVWSNMFEFTSRTAAYSLFKEKMHANNIANGMDNQKGPNGEISVAELAAAEQAAAETKNLANFEKVGSIGKELGALYMFFRPSAMGAARAIETVAPAFMSEERMLANMPANLRGDTAAQAKYLENYKQLRTNARYMSVSLMGMGLIGYFMSMMMAPDDEWKRNSVRNDDMQQWTKFLRFHIPDAVAKQIFGNNSRDVVFQMPWGYGLGAFAAMGAQIGSMMTGQTSFKEGVGNILMSILSDSFLPIPMSRIPPTESLESSLKWAVDSVTPSVLRPIVEYIMNTNGIGQAINSANMRKYGEAFTGGDKIPEIYKDVSAYLYKSTEGKWNWSPNSMYFFANSYADGLARVFENTYNWKNLLGGNKGFNPKTDFILIGSFFGSKSNVDSREYTAVEAKVKDLAQRMKTLEAKDPITYMKFMAHNPMADSAVGLYNSETIFINKIREEANEIRNAGYSPKVRDELLRLNILQQNMAKHQLVTTLRVYGITP
jgi:hypothetical protein